MNSASIKRIIGIVLLIVGLWVTYDGYNTSETVTLILGVASILGGLAFLFLPGKNTSVAH